MLDACVMMIARDSEDYIMPCVSVIAPHVSRVKITIDSRSKDTTRYLAESLAREHPNVSVSTFNVENPIVDLVKMRNSQLPFDETWGFIVDSDEYHFDVENYRLGYASEYGFTCYAVWNETRAHKSSSRARIGRIFKNVGKLEWRGRWGKEKLYRDEKPVFSLRPPILPYRYIHFTHLKKDKWREEMKQLRIADGKHLFTMPEHIIKLIRNVHENSYKKMPVV